MIAYRSGMNLTNPLIPICVADDLTGKSLPPTNSFASVQQDNIIISTIKKADLNSSLIMRLYDIEDSRINTSVTFLNSNVSFREVNLLEEETGKTTLNVLSGSPYSIKSIKFSTGNRK